jgi:hypothetical protein
MWYNNRPAHVIIISMIVYIVLNIIENIIYYNGGKFGLSQNISVYFTIPKMKDLCILLLIMIFFAFLQGLMTFLLS